MSIKPEEITQILKEQIENFPDTQVSSNVGTILSAGDGITRIYGLSDAVNGELVEFDDGSNGMVINLEEDNVGVVLLGSGEGIKEGAQVKSTGKIASIPVSQQTLGRVVDPLGNVLDNGPKVEPDKYMPLEKIAPGIIERKSVHEPLQTGIASIDAMIPIGRGQRELIIGDRQTGKTAIAIDTILNQKNVPESERPICVYVSIGQKQGSVARTVKKLEEAGALDYTVVVHAGSTDSSAMQFLAPYAGVAIAEYFLAQGKHVLCIYDDLTKHAWAYRAMSLLLRRPPGREAYPGDVFYIHSRLLERACKMSDSHGAGSITALPIIETQAGDVSAYIPTNVISITDGQIFLDSNLFNSGIRPAIDVGISVSRVGGSAQIKSMKKVSGTLKLDQAQYRELEAFAKFGSDLDAATMGVLDKGARNVEILKQNEGSPLPVEEQVAIIYCGSTGIISGIPTNKVKEFENNFLELMRNKHRAELDVLKSGKLTAEVTDVIKKVVAEMSKSYAE